MTTQEKINKLNQITEEIKKRIDLKTINIIGISGFGGSGKSTIAKELGNIMNIPVIGIDSFQKVGAFTSKFHLWEIMDFERLIDQVLIPFKSNQSKISYQHFDASIEKISEIRQIKNTGQIIVEGVGLFRPELDEYLNYKIWVDCPLDEAIARGKKRDRQNGSPVDDLWDGIWKQNDLEYLEVFHPNQNADYILLNN